MNCIFVHAFLFLSGFVWLCFSGSTVVFLHARLCGSTAACGTISSNLYQRLLHGQPELTAGSPQKNVVAVANCDICLIRPSEGNVL